MFRLGISVHRDRFVLKGAMLMTSWFEDPHRPTRDVDFLGFGESEADHLLATFAEVCALAADDGISFDAAGLRAEAIREDTDYGGLRLRTTAQLAGARIPVVIDIGFGDATEPGTEEIQLRVLLDQPEPRLRAYARETVVAEKFQAMVMLGMANTRLKDFYDIWFLSQSFEFDDGRLAAAIAATFARRKTNIPADPPFALSPDFANDKAKQTQWLAFARDLAAVPPLYTVVADLAAFLMPHAARARLISAA
ncbi:nucleotidyl transferase AbiEii/AbiGii toxin family protein [Cupriavidus sp. PET2-C1]